MPKSTYRDVIPYRTRDGSEIRELMHPDHHGSTNQSLAEAIVAPGGATLLHRHLHSEEIYHFTAGEGRMQLGAENIAVRAGDTVCIPPGVPHSLQNCGQGPLRLLCCCAPPYRHDDTEIIE